MVEKDKNIIKKKIQISRALATAHAAKVVRGRWIDENSPVAQTLKKCDECAIREGCGQFIKHMRCFYQIQNIKAEYKLQGALTSGDPRDLLKSIQNDIAQLESIVKYNEMVGKQPRIQDIKELAFLKLQVYEMLYGRSKQPLTQVNVNAPSMDVKELMSTLRKKEVDEVEVVEDEKGTN